MEGRTNDFGNVESGVHGMLEHKGLLRGLGRWHIDWSCHLTSIAFTTFSMFICFSSTYETIHMY